MLYCCYKNACKCYVSSVWLVYTIPEESATASLACAHVSISTRIVPDPVPAPTASHTSITVVIVYYSCINFVFKHANTYT